jgi:hypothetical protein
VPERAFPVSIPESHHDYQLLARLRSAIFTYAGGENKLISTLPVILQDAIDFVLDPVRTARTKISELDNVEKTFIGLKIEHCLRDFLNVPKGLRDLHIDNTDVDVKNTVGATWMIPPETYRNEEPCLLIAIADTEKRFWLGLIVARNDYLGSAKGNRDAKRSVVKKGMESILWIVAGKKLPASRWNGIDMARFRDLRMIKGGSKRAASFFRENIGKAIHRNVVQTLLFDQKDYMKRIRGNGGARDILKRERIALLSATFDRKKLEQLSSVRISKDEFIAIHVE